MFFGANREDYDEKTDFEKIKLLTRRSIGRYFNGLIPELQEIFEKFNIYEIIENILFPDFGFELLCVLISGDDDLDLGLVVFEYGDGFVSFHFRKVHIHGDANKGTF